MSYQKNWLDVCHEEVVGEDGELEPCELPSVGFYKHPGDDYSEPSTYPVCVKHVREDGMVENMFFRKGETFHPVSPSETDLTSSATNL